MKLFGMLYKFLFCAYIYSWLAKMSALSSDVQKRILRVFAVSLPAKMLTFGLGVWATRAMTAEAKGISFTFEVYTLTSGFLAREAVRSTNARQKVDLRGPDSIRKIANMAFCTLPIGLLALLLGYFFFSFTQSGSEVYEGVLGTNPWLVLALYGLGQAFDLYGETLQSVVQASMDLRVKAFWEAQGIITKLLTTIGLLKLGMDANVAISAGWFVYGMTLLAVVWRSVYWSKLPNDETGDGSFRRELFQIVRQHGLQIYPLTAWSCFLTNFRVWLEFFSESCLRLLLTEGEKFMLSAFGALSAQGIYDLVTNLGSLVARIIFRVWEESCFLAVSRCREDTTEQKRDRKSLLRRMTHWALYLGLLFSICGPPLSRTFLTVVYSSRWATDDAVQVLSAYCYYVPLMGLNGLMEAFARGIATGRQFNLIKGFMVACSIAYLAACYFALAVFHLGVVGLIYANCASMTLRILFSYMIIAQSDNSITPLDIVQLPTPIMAVGGAVFVGTRFGTDHLLAPIVGGIALVVAIVLSDETFKRFVRRNRRQD